MQQISEDLKFKIINHIFKIESLLEKSFFDLDEAADDTDKDTKDMEQDDASDNNTSDEDDSDNDFSIQHKLQLKLLYSSMVNMLNLSKYLYTINKDKFGPIYENYTRLFNYFKDYINNFDDLEPNKKVKLLKLFREAFKTINKKTFDTLNKL